MLSGGGRAGTSSNFSAFDSGSCLLGETCSINLEFYFPKDSITWIVLLAFICHVKRTPAAPDRNAPGTCMSALPTFFMFHPIPPGRW